MRFLILGLFLFFQLFTIAQSSSRFPEGIYWVNSSYNLSPETFKDKYVIVVFWNMNDPVAQSQVRTLQAFCAKYQQFQLLSIVQGDAEHKINLSELTDFTQEHNIYHPFGIASSLEPFFATGSGEILKIFTYDKSVSPTSIVTDPALFPDFFERLKTIAEDKEKMAQYGAWQMRSEILPRDYADPILELPSVMAATDDGSSLFVAENTLNRIVQYNPDGSLGNLIGGIDRGDKDSNLRGLKFSYISGMDWDNITEQLFVADIDNQKVKAIDLKSGIGYTVIGNGAINPDITAQIKNPLTTPLSYPVDVAVKNRSLYILMANPAQLLEVDITSGALKSNAVLETKLGNFVRPVKLSKGTTGFLIVTTSGCVYELAYEGDTLNPKKVYEPKEWLDFAGDVQQRKDVMFISLPRKNQVVSLKKGKLKMTVGDASPGYANSKKPAEARFFQPIDLLINANKIIIADRRNNMLRFCSIDKGVTVSFAPKYDFEYFTVGEALNIGEPVFLESEILSEGKNEIFLQWDISGYEILESGYNALVSDLSPGVSWGDNAISKEGVRFVVDTRKSEEYVQVELYLTLVPKSNPDLIVLKRAAINLSFAVIPGESDKVEILYTPKLLH